jgi:hypothetical protein
LNHENAAPGAAHRAGLIAGRLIAATVIVGGLGALALLARHALRAHQAAQGALTPAAQLLALPGGTLVADPDYAYISLAGARQAGYGVLYDGKKWTVGAYLVAQTATRAQAEALADRYFARAAHSIRGAGGALYASPRGGGDAWSFVYTGMVGGTCSYGAGFVRGTAFYQLVLLSGGLDCKAAVDIAQCSVAGWAERIRSSCVRAAQCDRWAVVGAMLWSHACSRVSTGDFHIIFTRCSRHFHTCDVRLASCASLGCQDGNSGGTDVMSDERIWLFRRGTP